MTSLTSRAPSFFCCSSSSSTWLAPSRPSSTSASAMRSPNDFTLAMMILSERLADVCEQILRWRQIPHQPVGRGGGDFLGGLLVEGIGGGHQNRLAHPVKGRPTPTAADVGREPAHQVNVHIVFCQRHVRRCPILHPTIS